MDGSTKWSTRNSKSRLDLNHLRVFSMVCATSSLWRIYTDLPTLHLPICPRQLWLTHRHEFVSHFDQASLQFCAECNNLLYPKADPQRRIMVYACRICAYDEINDNKCVYRNDLLTVTKWAFFESSPHLFHWSLSWLLRRMHTQPGSCEYWCDLPAESNVELQQTLAQILPSYVMLCDILTQQIHIFSCRHTQIFDVHSVATKSTYKILLTARLAHLSSIQFCILSRSIKAQRNTDDPLLCLYQV